MRRFIWKQQQQQQQQHCTKTELDRCEMEIGFNK